MMTFLVIAVVFLLSWLGTELFRRFSLKRSILDIPNERSSHATPVPRGGGILVVILSLAVYVIAAAYYHNSISFGFLIGATLVAAISLADDLVSIPFFIRLAVHMVAAAVLIYDIGSLTAIHLPMTGRDISFGLAGPAVTVFWLVWMINSYNFMDGIDGIAGTQALVAAGGWMVIGYNVETQAVMVFCASVAASVAGFLLHNWSPARIFMGDVGSAFLGFTFGAIPLLIARESHFDSGWLFAIAITILWPFLFDTVYTLLRRTVKGERLWEAHRSHLYQRLVAAGYSHRAVSLLYGSSTLVLTSLAVIALASPGRVEWLLLVLSIMVAAVLLISAHPGKTLT